MNLHIYSLKIPMQSQLRNMSTKIKYGHIILLDRLWKLPKVLKLLGREFFCQFSSKSNETPFSKSEVQNFF